MSLYAAGCPTPRISSPPVLIRALQDQARSRPTRAAQLAARPLPNVASLVRTSIECVSSAPGMCQRIRAARRRAMPSASGSLGEIAKMPSGLDSRLQEVANAKSTQRAIPTPTCYGALGSSSHPAGVLRLLHRNSRKLGWRLQVSEGTRADVFSRLSRSRWQRRFMGFDGSP